ncbi:MAG: hypothetical protein WCR47_09355 [Desulfoplanes sp.]
MGKQSVCCKGWPVWALVLCCLFMGVGCGPQKLQPNAKVSFDIPSRISVIKKGARVRIFTTGNRERNTAAFVRELTTALNNAGWFKVVSSQSFEYAMNINTFRGYRRDTDGETQYNLKVFKKSQTDNIGNGRDFLVSEAKHSAIAAYVTTVSIYEVRTLEPMAYFNIVASQGMWEDQANSLPSAAFLDKKLSDQIVKRMRNLLSSERRDVGVILPAGGDQKVKNMLVAGKISAAAKRAGSLIPGVPLAKLTPMLYEQWAEAAKKAQKEGNTEAKERDMEEDLATNYLLLMAREASGVAEDALRQIHDGYAKILALTDNQDMVNACAHSLSRVEQNARRLNVNLRPE